MGTFMENVLRKPSTIAKWLRLPLCVVALAVFSSGCAAKRKSPIYLNPAFAPGQVESVTLLPAADFRRDKHLKTDFQKILTNTGEGRVKSRKYKVLALKDTALSVRESDLLEAKPEWIGQLGPADAQWIMVLGVEQVTRFTTADSEAVAEVSGTLIDKRNRTVAWRGVGKGWMRAGLLVGGLVDNDAVRMAALDLFHSLPKRTEQATDYPVKEDVNLPPARPNGAMVKLGMTQSEITELFGKTETIRTSPDGQSWIYHENMGNAFIPFAGLAYRPKIWVLHFDSGGKLVKYHFIDPKSFE
jgi:hypothetical protein